MSSASSSIHHKAAAGVSGLASILQLVAIATPGWFKFTFIKNDILILEHTYGLWQRCTNGTCVDYPFLNLAGTFLAKLRRFRICMSVCV